MCSSRRINFYGRRFAFAFAFVPIRLVFELEFKFVLTTGATVAMNHWNRWFFDSLEARDVAAVTSSIFVFAAIIATMAALLTLDKIRATT